MNSCGKLCLFSPHISWTRTSLLLYLIPSKKIFSKFIGKIFSFHLKIKYRKNMYDMLWCKRNNNNIWVMFSCGACYYIFSSLFSLLVFLPFLFLCCIIQSLLFHINLIAHTFGKHNFSILHDATEIPSILVNEIFNYVLSVCCV